MQPIETAPKTLKIVMEGYRAVGWDQGIDYPFEIYVPIRGRSRGYRIYKVKPSLLQLLEYGLPPGISLDGALLDGVDFETPRPKRKGGKALPRRRNTRGQGR